MTADYTILSPVPKSEVHVRLAGMGRNHSSEWDLHIYTLAAFYLQCERSRDLQLAPDNARQIIHVVDDAAGRRSVSVALAVSVIDATVVRNTVIMVRNYKRLAPGLHQWGPVMPLDHAP